MTDDPRFDTLIDWRGSGNKKWDLLERATGVTSSDGIGMWVADMDFPQASCLRDAAHRFAETGAYGYFELGQTFREAVCWWMKTRHGWHADPQHIVAVAGLGNGIATVIEALTEPGDGIIVFTPVYDEFSNRIRTAGREVVESPLVIVDGLFQMDLEATAKRLTGRERAVFFCSPHNPAGRVWSVEEQRALAAFCAEHDLLLFADEVHHDLVMPGHRHVSTPVAIPEASDRLVVLTAASKSFNVAGLRTGCLKISNHKLRGRVSGLLERLSLNPNRFGVAMTMAAYSPEGAEWIDALCAYLDGNRRLFSDGVAEIPGVSFMPMQATYLAWVDFAGTGMEYAEFHNRVTEKARIGPTSGQSYGTGGETCLRFNLGTQRARVSEAVARLQSAFADLQ